MENLETDKPPETDPGELKKARRAGRAPATRARGLFRSDTPLLAPKGAPEMGHPVLVSIDARDN